MQSLEDFETESSNGSFTKLPKSKLRPLEPVKPESYHYIPGGRIASTDIDNLFSEDDEELDDEAFFDDSSLIMGKTRCNMLDHPLRLLSSSALKKDTIVETDQAQLTRNSLLLKNIVEDVTYKNDLPDLLFKPKPPAVDPWKPDLLEIFNKDLHYAYANVQNSTMTSTAGKHFRSKSSVLEDSSSHIYETLKFDHVSPRKTRLTSSVYDVPENVSPVKNESYNANANFLYHSPASDPKSHVYTIIDKRSPQNMTTTSQEMPRRDSGVHSVSFLGSNSSPESTATSNKANIVCQQTASLDHCQKQRNQNKSKLPRRQSTTAACSSQKHNSKSKAEEKPSLKRNFAGRLSLKLRKHSDDDELGSVVVACPKNAQGVFSIPFDELESPTKFPEKENKNGNHTSLKSRWTQLRTSVKRSLSFRK